VTVELSVPVVERVKRQLTQGEPEPLERFACPVWVALPVKVKVKLQSGVVCAAAVNAAAKSSKSKGTSVFLIP